MVSHYAMKVSTNIGSPVVGCLYHSTNIVPYHVASLDNKAVTSI